MASAPPRVEPGSPPGSRGGGLAALPDGRVRSAASDAATFTVGVYVAQAMLFVAGVAQKGLLGPRSAGYWALMGTFATFLSIASLGALEGAGRQIPFYRGRDNRDSAAAAADTASSFTILASAVAGGLLVALALVAGPHWAPEVQYGILILGVLAPLRFLSDAHEGIIQATKRFNVASMAVIVRALIVLTLQTVLVILFGYYGMFMGLAASTLGVFVLWNRLGLVTLRQPAFRWRIQRGPLRELLRLGIPMMIHSQIWLLFLAIDNLIVAHYIDVTNLGYYALAVSVTTYIMFLPKSIGAVLGPRMSERFGATQQIRDIQHYATDVQRLLADMLIPLFVAGAFFFLPVLIRHALPAFTPAIAVVQIMVVASFFISLSNMPIKILHTTGRNWGLAGFMLVCLVLNGAGNYVAVAVLDFGLRGAAAATSISYLIVFLAVTAYALGEVLGTRSLLKHLGELLAVVGYTGACLWGIEWLAGSGEGALYYEILVNSAKFVAFLALMTPWLVRVQRRYGGLTAIWRLLEAGARKVRRRTLGDA